MLTKLHKGLSYANVMATLAVFIAMGGSSYAAVVLTKNSVLSKHIKDGQVTSADVRNSSLLARDFKPGQLPAGPQGPQGPQGQKGDSGDRGPSGATNAVIRSMFSTSNQATADCAPGERATGGGHFGVDTGVTVTINTPTTADRLVGDGSTPTGWHVKLDAVDSAWYVEVVCVSP